MRYLLAIESSCDETAVAVCREDGLVLSSEVRSQVELHRPFGGVVPELASRSHLPELRPLIELALKHAELKLKQIDAFAATAGPGLASALLVGHTTAKALALACKRPFIAVNHLEGHLLSPFMNEPRGVHSAVGLIVSGGHTMLVHVRGIGDYQLLGKTRDDAAGEAFDKVGKMLGLDYPAGPIIDQMARGGNTAAYAFPRSMTEANNLEFSFSGLKTSVRYLIPRIEAAAGETPFPLPDVCASFQEAVVEVLLNKAVAAARLCGERTIAVSGGVSCNSRLRALFSQRCAKEKLSLLLALPSHCTDNAAMIGYAAAQRLKLGLFNALEEEIDPNLPLVSGRNAGSED